MEIIIGKTTDREVFDYMESMEKENGKIIFYCNDIKYIKQKGGKFYGYDFILVDK